MSIVVIDRRSTGLLHVLCRSVHADQRV